MITKARILAWMLLQTSLTFAQSPSPAASPAALVDPPVSPVPSAESGPAHDLRYKASATGDELTYHTVVRESVHDYPQSASAEPPPDIESDDPPAGSQSATGVIETEQTVRYQYQALDADTLSVTSTLDSFQLTVDGEKVEYRPESASGSKQMSSKGYRKVAGKSAGDFDKLEVVMPLEPVPVGGEWTYTAPPTQDLPIFLMTVYTLKDVRELDGRKVAIIQGKTHADEVDPVRSLRIQIDGTARVQFDIEAGQLIRSNFRLRMITAPANGTGGKVLKVIRTENSLVPKTR